MRTAAIIIAGGRSLRMGQEKAFVMLRGQTMLSRIIARIGPQVGALAINASGGAARFAGSGLPVIPDEIAVGTPLAGLHAALRWGAAQGFDAILTVPSDSPFLPRDLAVRLDGPRPAVAASGGHTHYLTGFWPTALLHALEAVLCGNRHPRESGNPAFAGVTNEGEATAHGELPRVQDWVRLCHAHVVEWPTRPYDRFFNVNTPEDLAEAERIAAEFDA